MNCRTCAGLGRVRLSRAPFVAHRGTGPETVSRTSQPRATAPATRGADALQAYFDGFVASKSGRTRDVAAGATFCQSSTIRVDLTPKLEISSRACVRVAGLARSTGASKVMVCERDACAALGRAAATSAQRQRARGAIRDMSGGGRVLAYNRSAGPKVAVPCARAYPDRLAFGAHARRPCPGRHRREPRGGRAQRAPAPAGRRAAAGVPRRARARRRRLHPAVRALEHVARVGLEDDPLARAEPAHVDRAGEVLGHLAQPEVLVAIGVEVDLALRVAQRAEVALEVLGVRRLADEEAHDERRVDELA